MAPQPAPVHTPDAPVPQPQPQPQQFTQQPQQYTQQPQQQPQAQYTQPPQVAQQAPSLASSPHGSVYSQQMPSQPQPQPQQQPQPQPVYGYMPQQPMQQPMQTYPAAAYGSAPSGLYVPQSAASALSPQFPYQPAQGVPGYAQGMQPGFVGGDGFKLLAETHGAGMHAARRIDELHDKVDGIAARVGGAAARHAAPAVSEVAGADLVTGVQRLLEELGKAKTELAAKTERAESLQQRVTELLEKQERYRCTCCPGGG
jgi:hypothetical protein